MYKVLRYFTDTQDENHAYHTGDTFPRGGVVVSDERVAELAGSNNKRGLPLIAGEKVNAKAVEAKEEAEEKPKPKRAAKKKG